MEHTCSLDDSPCQTKARDCSEYTRIVDCCCHQKLATKCQYLISDFANLTTYKAPTYPRYVHLQTQVSRLCDIKKLNHLASFCKFIKVKQIISNLPIPTETKINLKQRSFRIIIVIILVLTMCLSVRRVYKYNVHNQILTELTSNILDEAAKTKLSH